MRKPMIRGSRGRMAELWSRAALSIAGLLALGWFLVRVIPKPSRAAYPCQRASFPVASAFVIYLAGLASARFAWKTAAVRLRQGRVALALLAIAGGGGAYLASEAMVATRELGAAPFIPADAANTPMGIARGIHPGRVAWAHNPDATDWSPELNSNRDGLYYWDDDHTNQAAVDMMLRECLLALTGEPTEPAAWDALFRHFNREHGKGDVGYQPGEVVFIKTNHVDQRRHDDIDNCADMAPQVEQALLDQLVRRAGVPESAIRFGDPSRFVADKSYERLHALFPDVVYGEGPFYNPQYNPGTAGRAMFRPSTDTLIAYSGKMTTGEPMKTGHVPQVAVEADYIINLAIMKGHASAGVTLTGKNWYGCLGETPTDGNHNRLVNVEPHYAQYRCMVDLMGHPHLGGKVMLNVFDALWGFPYHGGSSRPMQWENTPFNGDYPSSILVSQDAVALDSVGVDFLRAEFEENMGLNGNVRDAAVDDYLHEAALAAGAPSGTTYDPDGDGAPLDASLGVHEHWNNPIDKQYSVNLGTGEGIELIALDTQSAVGNWRSWR